MKNGFQPVIRPLGEDSILVEFEPEVSWEVNGKVRRLLHTLGKKGIGGYRMSLPAYRSLMVFYDPWEISDDRMLSEVKIALTESELMDEPEGRLFRLPTVYGGKWGPDVDRVAELSGITAQKVITLSSNLKLPVYFLGYICSQAYMGGIPKELQSPRHQSPRSLVPGGSFGFGGPQANILAVDSPSGLNYVGRTFVKVFNPDRFPPTAFSPGDFVQCYAVDEKTAIEAGKKPMEDFIEPLCHR
jgi:KipI family sensor histidine kinase inhibitor